MHPFTHLHRTAKRLADFCADGSGQFAVMAAILSVPLLGAVGLAIDYARLSNAYSIIRQAQDAAMLAGTRAAADAYIAGESSTAAIKRGKQVATDVFKVDAARLPNLDMAYFKPEISITSNEASGTSTYGAAPIATLFGDFVGRKTVDVAATNRVAVGLGDFLDLHIMVDVSQSMGVGATDADIVKLANTVGCAFACHTPPAMTQWWDTIGWAKWAGAKLRIDAVRVAVKNVVDRFIAANQGTRIRIAIHGFSNNLLTRQALTSDMALVTAAVDKLEISNEYGEGGTGYDRSLEQATTLIGKAGTGSQAISPRKVLILLTDGVATNLKLIPIGPTAIGPNENYVVYAPTVNGGGGVWSSQGFNPAGCKQLKTNGVEVFTIETEYVLPKVGVGSDTRFNQIDQKLAADIKKNMTACASSSDHAFTVDQPDEIMKAMNDIYDSVSASKLRLTN